VRFSATGMQTKSTMLIVGEQLGVVVGQLGEVPLLVDVRVRWVGDRGLGPGPARVSVNVSGVTDREQMRAPARCGMVIDWPRRPTRSADGAVGRQRLPVADGEEG